MKSGHFYSKNSLHLSAIAALIGVFVAYGVVGFRYILNVLNNLIFYQTFDLNLLSPVNHDFNRWIILFPLVGIILSAFIVRKLAKDAKGHGVPEIIEAVMAHGGKIRENVVLVNLLASVITIVFGAPVGKTGPAVQFAALVGSAVARFFKLHAKYKRIFVGCGAAAAISALFNAPIAAVIFGMELIVSDFRPKSFILFAISSICSTIIFRWHLGGELAFFVPQYNFISHIEWGLYPLLGVLGGVCGILIIKSIYGMEDFFETFEISFFTKALIGGLVVGVFVWLYPNILGVGYEVIDDVLQEKFSFNVMFALLLLKTLLLGVSFAAGGCGGVIAPSLYVGAMVGGAFGVLAGKIFPGSVASYSTYALLGMAAVFSSTNRATFTAIALIFEMTLDYSVVLPLMVVCVVADQVSAWIFSNKTIYTLKLERKGLRLIDNFSVSIYSRVPIRDVMETDVDLLHVDDTLQGARDLIEQTNHISYPVIDEEGAFVGVIRAKEIMHESKGLAPDTKIKSMLVGIPCAVYPHETVFDAVMKYHANRDPRIFVVDPQSKKFLGMVSPHTPVK